MASVEPQNPQSDKLLWLHSAVLSWHCFAIPKSSHVTKSFRIANTDSMHARLVHATGRICSLSVADDIV